MLPPQNFYTLVVPTRPTESYATLVASASESETERKRGIGGVESRHPLRNPFALPLEYAQALDAKLDAVRRLQCSLLAVPPVQQQQQSNASAGEEKAASNTPPSAPDTPPPALTRTLPPGGARAVEEAVQAHFGDWLVASGNIRQILDLVQLDRAKYASGRGYGDETVPMASAEGDRRATVGGACHTAGAGDDEASSVPVPEVESKSSLDCSLDAASHIAALKMPSEETEAAK